MSKRYTEEEIYAMTTMDAWRVTFRQLPHKALEDYKYNALINLANSPFTIADDMTEAIELLTMMHDTFEHRYNKGWGDSKQNATLAWLSEVNRDRLQEDYDCGVRFIP